MPEDWDFWASCAGSPLFEATVFELQEEFLLQSGAIIFPKELVEGIFPDRMGGGRRFV
jgi:hypothetical protein